MRLDEHTIQRWYGRAEGLAPDAVRDLFAGSGLCWAVAGGRSARIGATPRPHGDTDVEIPRSQLDGIRAHLEQSWHLWQVFDGALEPLFPDQQPRSDLNELWLRRDADTPWQLEILLRPGDEREWVYRRDPQIRLPVERAHQVVDDVVYLRPELALLFKAKNDRPKDRADLMAASLDQPTRDWLATTLQSQGHREWAELLAQRPATTPQVRH